jgi:hypothetical protein
MALDGRPAQKVGDLRRRSAKREGGHRSNANTGIPRRDVFVITAARSGLISPVRALL